MNKRILLVCKTIGKFKDDLEQSGFDIECAENWTREEVLEQISEYEGLIIRSKFKVNKELLDRASVLEFVGRIGSGMENVDLEYAERKKVRVYRSPEGNANAVAEHAMGMILALLNKFHRCDRMVREFDWDREAARGERIEEKTIALIGYGHVGKAMHRRLKCFGVKIIAYDKYLEREGILVGLDEVYKEADIVSFHVPLTAETKHFMDIDFIQRMKKPFYLINTSRGGVVKTKDLLWGMERGKILGLALDVFEYEDLEISKKINRELMQRLFEFEDVILSPHVAGWNQYSKRALHDILFKKIVEHELSSY